MCTMLLKIALRKKIYGETFHVHGLAGSILLIQHFPLKLIYRFNTISFKTPASFFLKNRNKLILVLYVNQRI